VATGDTLGLHVAVSQNVPTVALFGPTCAQEIDLFDRGVTLVTELPCAPCYRRNCDIEPHCMDLIKAEAIVAALKNLVQ
jgi:heptosyltransferase-2